MKKALSLILTLTLLLSAMLGVTSSAEGESGAELDITSANLQFASTVYLLVSVDYSAYGIDENGAMSAVTLTVTGKDGVESAPLSADAEVMATEGFPEGAVGFKYTDLGAKNMGDELTLQAYYNGEKSGDPSVYSVLEYTIKAKETYPSDTALALVCDTLIAFGAEAQKSFGYTGDFDLSKNHSLVKLIGGATFSNGLTKAILEEGTESDLTASHYTFCKDVIWYNTKMQVRSTEDIAKFSYNGMNETYFAAPADIAAEKALDMDERESSFYFYGIEYTKSYSASTKKFTNSTDMRFVKDGVLITKADDLGAEWWLTGSSFPGGGSSTDAKAGGTAMNFAVSSTAFADYLKENTDLTDEAVDALTLLEKYELKAEGASNTYYKTFYTAAMNKLYTLDEVKANSTAYGIFDAENGWIRYQGNMNFNSTEVGSDIYKAVGAYLNGDASAPSCFTITTTMAADGANKGVLNRFSLRNNNHPYKTNTTVMVGTTQGTRISFFTGGNSTIKTGYNIAGTSATSDKSIYRFDVNGVGAGNPSEFVAFYTVFDLENREIRHYIEGAIDEPVATIPLPEALDTKVFFGTDGKLPTFNGQLANGYMGYLKTFSITTGDITIYMQ